MSIERLKHLLDQYVNNRATNPEKEELRKMISEPANKPVFTEVIAENLQFEKNEETNLESFTRLAQKAVQVDKGDTDVAAIPVRTLFSWRLKWVAAASVVLIIGTISYFFFDGRESSVAIVEPRKAGDILPGRMGAVLTLANGKQILLDTAKKDFVISQGALETKVVGSSLVYEGKGAQQEFNTVSTPNGRQYQLKLPDGTRVWLNAASSVHYPLAFSGNERKVDITGEVYFEVEKNAGMPFIVNVNNKATIKVTGTHFNVNAYDNEPNITATLLEGKIKMTAGNREKALIPGQQALSGEGTVFVKPANEEEVMAWKNGFFNFENVSLEEVMRQLERWYDIEVKYSGAIPDIELEGKMTRDVTLNGLLNVLKKLNVNAVLQGRTLIVTS
ncbi:FecR family protein [Parafilimonas sp.]|uniref:FecR family protein n=1 Tax=Parafilimonas sp. TaxID=1969739 RepID=UPI0039E6CF18